jgi:hypothetical protein
MTRLACIAAAALAFAASTPLLCATTTPASAQSWRDDGGMGDGDLRDLLMDRRSDRRDMLMDLLSDRRERRGDIMDLLSDRRERRGDIMDLLSDRRERRGDLMDLIGDNGDDGDMGGGLRGRLRERLSDRLGAGDEENCFFVTRTMRDEGGDWMVLVRRRVCRD